MSKNYAVVLTENAQTIFPSEFASVLRTSGELHYFLAKKIDPNGSFFYMELDSSVIGVAVDMQLHIPHGLIRYVFASTDVKKLGFI